MEPVQTCYRGRFAPSPTGPLHLGSLYTALASFLYAKSQGGQWLLRIDDLDTPRNANGAASAILAALDKFGLHWDGAADYQSQHLPQYQDCLDSLLKQQQLYRCACSRKSLAAYAADAYPGICRQLQIPESTPHALRVKTDPLPIGFDDQLQGRVSQNLGQHGDFIVKRKEGIIAYQFAVVVDDYRQGITHVVRGMDLLDATPKQIYLQQLLGLPTPVYSHVPIIVDAQGQKLSKQNYAAPVDALQPTAVMFKLLQWLKQAPPVTLQRAPLAEQLGWAVGHWQADALKNCRSVRLPPAEH